MKIQITNHMTGETLFIEGNENQVDAQLRQRFPGPMHDVAPGDVAHGVYEVSRLQYYFVNLLDGELPAQAPPNDAIQYDLPESFPGGDDIPEAEEQAVATHGPPSRRPLADD